MSRRDKAQTEAPEVEVAEATPVEETKKKRRRLSKSIAGNVLTIIEADTNTTMTFDAGSLPEGIQANLMPYGLSQKLGDAAAGKAGQVAVDAISKVWEGLVKGDWSVRAPATEKISKSSILDTYTAMEEGAEKEVFKGLLIKLGVIKA